MSPLFITIIPLFCLYINVDYTFAAYPVHELEPQVPFNCCPRHYYRTDPIIYCYNGREKNILYLWESVQLHLNLASDEFEQFDGSTPEEVSKQFEDRKASWYFNIYTTKKKVIRINPFNKTCVGIVSKNDYAVKLTRIRVDYWRVLMMVSGLVLFFLAPKLSSNSVFYYLCGVSFGTFASILILVYILSRFLPKKPIMYSFLASGWAIGLYIVQFLFDNMRTVLMEYKSYVLYYILSASVISFMICYRLGPVSDPRSINLITWAMQGVGLLLILFSSNFQEATLAFNMILLAGYLLPFRSFFRFIGKGGRWFRGMPKRRLLSEDEYYQQGVVETKRALDDLRGYCSSPECNQWRTILKLHDPVSSKSPPNGRKVKLHISYVEYMSTENSQNNSSQKRKKKFGKPGHISRFAKFVEGSSHLDDNEVLSFELEDNKENDDLLTEDSSSDDY